MSCISSRCLPGCEVACPEPCAYSRGLGPCVASCGDSTAVVYAPPVVVTFPGPILSSCPSHSIVSSSLPQPSGGSSYGSGMGSSYGGGMSRFGGSYGSGGSYGGSYGSGGSYGGSYGSGGSCGGSSGMVSSSGCGGSSSGGCYLRKFYAGSSRGSRLGN